jgi:hypothetical protein
MYVCMFPLESGKSIKTMKLHKSKGGGRERVFWRGRREGGWVWRGKKEGEEG